MSFHERRPEEGLTTGQRMQIAGVALAVAILWVCCWVGFMEVSRLRIENAELTKQLSELTERKNGLEELSGTLLRKLNPPLTPEQQAQQAIDKEVTWQSWHMPAEVQSELIDQPTLAYGIVGVTAGQQFADPHDDPEWHHTRREIANEICCCMVRGCMDDPKGDAIHHGIAANACVKAGHYELAVRPGPGQKFYRLCEKHHAQIGHGIGHGGSWTKFNLDIEADVKTGRWNSRGKSEWKFMDESELIDWVNEQVDPNVRRD